MSQIQLFVCCHRESPVPNEPLLVPIQVGAALADRRFPGYVHDNSGENISGRNRSYCELTAHYWAWKNSTADYVGFFHYRRYLYPELAARRPYRVETEPTEETLARLGFARFPALIEAYDMIVPKGEEMHVSVREHYAAAPEHRGEDLEKLERILREKSPDYVDAMERYFSGTVHYFGNILIMRREIFDAYCAWLFPLLEEFDRETDLSGRTAQEKRVDGYLAERLLGVFYTRYRDELKTLELPRVHFLPGKQAFQTRLLNALLPPGSRRRSLIKGLRTAARR